MPILVSFLWFFRTGKIFLFYFYLWQIKEYQVKRFIDHFRTYKGRELIFNEINLLKAGLFIFLLFNHGNDLFLKFLLWVLTFFYFVECLRIVKNIAEKRLKTPVLTIKTVFLIFAGFIAEIIILIGFFHIKSAFYFILFLLLFDIFSPIISSLLVISFQPLTIFLRNKAVKQAIEKRNKFENLLVIGITGSYGKTSTKEFLAAILSKKFSVLKTKEHENSEIGISRRILNDLDKSHQIFIVEMGAYGKGGIKLLCNIAKPKIGIVSGVNSQHLVLFGSMENLISAEGGIELAKSLPKNGVLVLNGNNELIMSNVKEKIKDIDIKKIFCGEGKKMDIIVKDINVEKENISFKVVSKKESADFKANLMGGYNAENILLAVATAKELGMTLKEISRALKNIKEEQGSMKLIKAKNGFDIIDSTYSANPDGVIADLEYLKIYKNKKVIVMPCLIELGRVSKETHYKIGKKIGEVCNLAIITTRDKFKDIKKGALKLRMKEQNILFIESQKEITDKLKIFLGSGDVVLFEGRINKSIIKSLAE